MATHVTVRAAAEVWPTPGTEPFPAANWPPDLLDSKTGAQTTQDRPDNLDNTELDRDGAVWSNAPGTLQYPIVINDAGGETPNGHDTWYHGAEIVGTDWSRTSPDPTGKRDVLYAHTSGIEHDCDSASGYAVGSHLRVSGIGDGYRFLGQGTAYLKHSYFSHLVDGMVEFDLWDGDAYIYNVLCEGAYSGISHSDSAIDNSDRTLTVDGLLLWIRPTWDTPSSQGGVWCGNSGGCAELDVAWADGKFRGSNGPWEGQASSFGTVNLENTWIRIDRPGAWGAPPMLWPGTSGAQWNNSAVLNIGRNVRVLWTGMDRGGHPTSDAYPYALPAGVALTSGPMALAKWNAAAAAMRTALGY